MFSASMVTRELRKLGTPAKARASSWFFKTGKGQYGYGDRFFGVTVPEQRRIAKKYQGLSLAEVEKLLQSKVHECRLTALLILVEQYKKADEEEKVNLCKFYLSHVKQINNWDLVDLSAPAILGQHLLKRSRAMLYKLARSKNLWERRMAVIATYAFIKAGEIKDTFKIAAMLLDDEHDLIHKAVGWMLRETGKKSLAAEEQFLKKHAVFMPRTMLRYAIEKLPEAKRKIYLC